MTLAGENDVLRQDTLTKLIDKFVSEHGDMALERIDAEEASYERIHEAGQGIPFLSNRKLVVLRRPGANKDFTEHFAQFLGDVAETNDVLIIEPKLDKRLGYYKLLKKLTEYRDFAPLDTNGLARYLMAYAKEQRGSLSSNDARLLIDRVGMNQLVLQHEVDKLVSYNTAISKVSIELLTERTPQSNVFDLLESAFAGDSKTAMALYDEQRAARVEPQQILAMLVWQLYILAVVKTAGARSSDFIAKDAKMSPYTVSKSASLAHNISMSQLKRFITELREFDVRLKREALSADEVARYYLLSLAA